MLWIILSLVIVATVFDLRTREVPDWIALAILTCAVLATAFGWSEIRWPGLIVGLLLGLACSVAVFYLGGVGGADVKLVAAWEPRWGRSRFCACSSGLHLQAVYSHLRPSLVGREISLTCRRLPPGF